MLFGNDIHSPLDIYGCQLWLDASQGLVENGASQFTAANSESLSIADNAALSTGDVDCWWGGWAYLDADDATERSMFDKGSSAAGGEYNIGKNTSKQFNLAARKSDDSGSVTVTAITFGAVTLATWYFVFAYHDSINNTINISVNGGAFDSAAFLIGLPDTTNAFQIGRKAAGGVYWDGRMDAVAFGKSPVGGIALSAVALRDRLYNGGLGIPYSSLSAAERTLYGLVSWWELDEISGTRADQLGGNTLTDNNTVTTAAGIVNKPDTTDGDPVAQWTDLSGNGRHAIQLTPAARPLEKNNIINGRPIVRFDAVDDYLKAATFTLAQPYTVAAVVWSRGSTINKYFWDGNTLDSGGGYQSAAGSLRMYAGSDGPVVVLGTTVPHVITAVYNGAASLLSLDGATDQTGDIGAGTPSGLTLGASGSNGNFGLVDHAEFVIYNRALSGTERSRLTRYLGRKYGISVQG